MQLTSENRAKGECAAIEGFSAREDKKQHNQRMRRTDFS
jgi:hypothetical protein